MTSEAREKLVYEIKSAHFGALGTCECNSCTLTVIALRDLAVRVERETLLEVLEKIKTVAAASTVRDRLRRMAAAVKS